MNTENPVLSVDKVTIAYSGKVIVSDISVQVPHGQTFGLIGLNGAGKTTIIKTLVGLRSTDSGEVSIEGMNPLNPACKKNMCYLPERFDPPWFLTGLEFIKFSLSLYGVGFNMDKVYAMSDELSLDHAVLKNKVQTYSKGMRQKLGLLANLLSECALIILDEPMSGLDPLARLCVKDALVKAKENGRTIFLSSHILSDMDEICDQVAVLHKGGIIFAGTPTELRGLSKDDSLERAFMHVIEDKAA